MGKNWIYAIIGGVVLLLIVFFVRKRGSVAGIPIPFMGKKSHTDYKGLDKSLLLEEGLYGSKEVKALQTYLNSEYRRLGVPKGLVVDGDFGKLTGDALEEIIFTKFSRQNVRAIRLEALEAFDEVS
ncbi:MAG: hypothetical protein AAFW00_19805 [Bacteroidota bacterium]